MKRWGLGLLTLLLALAAPAYAMAADTVSVTRGDGSSWTGAVNRPSGGTVWCAFYDGAGRMLDIQSVAGAAVRTTADAASGRLFTLNAGNTPAKSAVNVTFGGGAAGPGGGEEPGPGGGEEPGPGGGDTPDTDSILTERVCYNPDGSVRWRNELAYDKNGELSSVTAYDADGKLLNRAEIVLEDGWELAWESWSRLTGKVSWSAAKYDGNGNPVEVIRYGEDGRVEARETYQFDEEGRQIRLDSTQYYTSDTVWQYAMVYEYDSQGREVKVTQYSVDGGVEKLSYYTETIYAEDGTYRENQYNAEKELVWYTLYSIDEQGREREEQYSPDGKMDDYGLREWKDDRPVSYESYEPDGTLTYRWVNELDSAGNDTRLATYNRRWDGSSYAAELTLTYETLFENGREVQENSYSYTDGKLEYYILYQYGE